MSSWEEKLRSAAKKHKEKTKSFTSKITTSSRGSRARLISKTYTRSAPTLVNAKTGKHTPVAPVRTGGYTLSNKPKMTVKTYEQHTRPSIIPPTLPERKELKPVKIGEGEEKITTINIGKHRRVSISGGSGRITDVTNKQKSRIQKSDTIKLEKKETTKINKGNILSRIKTQASNVADVLVPGRHVIKTGEKKYKKELEKPVYQEPEKRYKKRVITKITDDSGKSYKVKNGFVYTKDKDKTEVVGHMKGGNFVISNPAYAKTKFTVTQEEISEPYDVWGKDYKVSGKEEISKRYKALTGKTLKYKDLLNLNPKKQGALLLSGISASGDYLRTIARSKAEQLRIQSGGKGIKSLAASGLEFAGRTAGVLSAPYNIGTSIRRSVTNKEPDYNQLSFLEKKVSNLDLSRKKSYQYGADAIEAITTAWSVGNVAKSLTKAQEIKQLNIERIKSANKILDDLNVPKITNKEAKLFHKLDINKKANLGNINKKIAESLSSEGKGRTLYTTKYKVTTKPRQAIYEVAGDKLSASTKSKSLFKDVYAKKVSEPVVDIIKRPNTIDILSKRKSVSIVNLGDDAFAVIKNKAGQQVTEIYKGSSLINYELGDSTKNLVDIGRRVSNKIDLQKTENQGRTFINKQLTGSDYQGAIFEKKGIRTITGKHENLFTQKTTGKSIQYSKSLFSKDTTLNIQDLKFDLSKQGGEDLDKILIRKDKLDILGKIHKHRIATQTQNRYLISKPSKIESALTSKAKTIAYKTKEVPNRALSKLILRSSDPYNVLYAGKDVKLTGGFVDDFLDDASRLVSKPKILSVANKNKIAPFITNFVTGASKIRSGSEWLSKSYLATRLFSKIKPSQRLNATTLTSTKQMLNVINPFKDVGRIGTKAATTVKTKVMPKPHTVTSPEITFEQTQTNTVIESSIKTPTYKPPVKPIQFKMGGFGFKLPYQSKSIKTAVKKQKKSRLSKYNKYLRDMWKTLSSKKSKKMF